MILLIDNYDSFTYNLYQYLAEMGESVEVFRNDALSTDDIAEMAPDSIVISPGPCTPNEAGVSCETIERFAGEIPILGVCLGHQCMGQVFGADIVRAPRLMHGKTSPIHHDGRTVFEGIESPFEAVRYHSLVIDPPSVPDCLEVSARSDRDEIMAARHRELVVEGVQFHPESIMTAPGKQLLRNFLELARRGAVRSAATA